MPPRDKSIHHRIQHFSFAGARCDFGPSFLILYAEKYAIAAKAMAPIEKKQEGKWHPVGQFLAGHSIELSLKAYLGLKGKTLSESKAASHNLSKLFAEARTKGLLSVAKLSKEQQFEIERASVYYDEKVFECPSVWEAVNSYPNAPDGDRLIEIAERLVAQLRQPCMLHDMVAKPSSAVSTGKKSI